MCYTLPLRLSSFTVRIPFSMPHYSLKQILASIADTEGKRRLIFNGAPLGSLGNKTIYGVIVALPFIEYALLFNAYSFEKLGIATAIIAYIVFLSTTMMAVFGFVWVHNRNIIKRINPSWSHYFPNVDLNVVMAPNYSPYRQFFYHYGDAIKKEISDDKLHPFIISTIALMEEENRDLLDVMGTPKR